MTLKRHGSRASLGFGWGGESIDRRYASAVEGDCTEPAETERAGGNADEAGASAMAAALRRRPGCRSRR